MSCSRLKMRDAQFSSKAYGTREYKEISIDGRIQFDLLVALQVCSQISFCSLGFSLLWAGLATTLPVGAIPAPVAPSCCHTQAFV